MRIYNWISVEESAPFAKLPVGGYVMQIVGVEDVAAREYLNITYDVAEGEYAGFYSDEWGRDNPWAHRFVRSYKETAQGMFKAFLVRLEESNPGFTVAAWQQRCDERELVGLRLGVVLQYEDYTNDKGDDKERLQVVGVYNVADIRSGDYKLPARKDSRKALPVAETPYYDAPAAAPATYAQPVPTPPAFGGQAQYPAYNDVPFS